MKTLSLLALFSLVTLNAHATYPVAFTCKGVAKNHEKIQFSLKGLISADPAAKKEAGNLTLNLQGQTNKGEVKIANQQVRALKTKYGSLIMYSVEASVKTTGYDQMAIAVTNKNNGSSTLTFLDSRSADLDSIEYGLACSEDVQ